MVADCRELCAAGRCGIITPLSQSKIAYLAGVSQPTVSRALRGSPMVSEETRRRIETIAQQLNYKVDKNASNLRCQHSNTLALLLFEDPTPDDSLINPFFLAMLGSITRACAQRGYDLLVSFQQQSGNWHVDYEDSRKADGIILLGYGDFIQYRLRLEQLVRQGTHFVRWGAVLEGQPGLSVGCDNFNGGREATQHLLPVYNKSHPDIPSFIERIRELVDSYRDRFTVAEVGGMDAEADLKSFTSGAKRFHSAYGFNFLQADRLTPRLVEQAVAAWPDSAGTGWPSWAFSNHDAPRAPSRWASTPDRAAMARVTMLLLACLLRRRVRGCRSRLSISCWQSIGRSTIRFPSSLSRAVPSRCAMAARRC